jgi:mRNA interferase HigB
VQQGIGGNNFRLIAFIEFRDNRVYVKHIVTHAEYDKRLQTLQDGG